MTKKPALLILMVLLMLFGGVTYLKSHPAEVAAPDTSGVRSGAERADVRRFWILYRQATEHRLAGEMEQAADAYRRALALNETHEDALYYLGNVLWALDEPEAARDAWARLATVNPNSARAHARLGDLHFCPVQEALFDLDVAHRAYTRAMHINKEETGPLLHLGQIALVRGDLAGAHQFFAAVTGSNYKSVAAHFLQGYIAWKQRAREQAQGRFAEAVRHARPEAPPQGVLGEGDTKPGTALPTDETATCEAFQPYLEDLARVQENLPWADIDRQYRGLDAFLAEIRTTFDVR